MNQELVSIVVCSYNSSKTILQTLDSIRMQDYENIDLIITDDSSTDDTLKLCYDWGNRNRSRFNRIVILKGYRNLGIPANLNRGCRYVESKWIKIVAADDILLPWTISELYGFAIKHNSYVVCSRILLFSQDTDRYNLIKILPKELPNVFINGNSQQQYNELLKHNIIPAASVFLSSEVLKMCGYFDECYRLIEDYPFWLKLARNGIRFDFDPDITVLYRISSGSITHGWSNTKTRIDFLKEKMMIKYYEIGIRNIIKHFNFHYDDIVTLIVEYIVRCSWKQYSANFYRIMNRIMLVILHPLASLKKVTLVFHDTRNDVALPKCKCKDIDEIVDYLSRIGFTH